MFVMIGSDLKADIPTKLPKGAGAPTAGEGDVVFAQLLANLDQPVAGAEASTGKLRAVDLPGGAAQKLKTQEALSDEMDALEEWAGSFLLPAAQAIKPGEELTGSEVEGAVPLELLAEQLGSTLRTFDEAYGTDTAAVVAQNAAAIEGLAEQLGSTLRAFNQAYGADTVAVVPQNAAAIEGLSAEVGTVPELPASLDAVQDFMTLARALLGVSTDLGDTAGNIPQQAEAGLIPGPDTSATIAPDAMLKLIRQAVTGGADALSAKPMGATQPTGNRPVPDVGSSGFAQNLTAQILGRDFAEGTTRIELAPRGLGVVEFALATDARGNRTMTVRADNPAVLLALRGEQPALAQALEAGGIIQKATTFAFAPLVLAGKPVPGELTQTPSGAEAARVTKTPEAQQKQAGPEVIMSVAGWGGGAASADRAGRARAALTEIEQLPDIRGIPAASELAVSRPGNWVAPLGQAAPSAPHTPSFAANIAHQIKGHQIVQGTTRIELAPNGLGGMEIDLSRDELGGLKVMIRAENASVLSALRDNRDLLLTVLREGGVAVQNGSLGFEDFGRGARQQPQPQQADAQPRAAEAEPEPETVIADTPPVQTVLPSWQVDIIT